MNSPWSHLNLKGISFSYQVYREEDLIETVTREYKVLNEFPDIYYNLENHFSEDIGLYKGCFLGKQKIIISSDREFGAIYNPINSTLHSLIPVIDESSFKRADFNIQINSTKLGQYYCDITLDTGGEIMMPKKEHAVEFARGATFAINGDENFQVWYDCCFVRNLFKMENIEDYIEPHINQYKVRPCNNNIEDYNLDNYNNRLLYPAEKWHSLYNGVRIYLNKNIKVKPIINLIQDWYPFINLNNIKNPYFLYKFSTSKSDNGIWFDNETGISGSWNGKLGSFRSINKLNNSTVKAIINFY